MLLARVAERSFGPGPHELLLVDPAVEEVMVNLRRGRCGSSALGARSARAAALTGSRGTTATNRSTRRRPAPCTRRARAALRWA